MEVNISLDGENKKLAAKLLKELELEDYSELVRLGLKTINEILVENDLREKYKNEDPLSDLDESRKFLAESVRENPSPVDRES